MNFEYAVKIMVQEDPTICPDCLKNRKENCNNFVICNKNLRIINNHDYNINNSFIIKCSEAFEIKKALKNDISEFKINNVEFKIEDFILKKKINNLWKIYIEKKS